MISRVMELYDFIRNVKTQLVHYHSQADVVIQVTTIASALTGLGFNNCTEVSIQRFRAIDSPNWELTFFKRKPGILNIFSCSIDLLPIVCNPADISLDFYVRSNVLIIVSVRHPY